MRPAVVAITPVGSLLLAIFVLMAGSGFLGTLLGIRLEAIGSSALSIGLVAAAYFAGLTLGSMFVTRVIEQVGHIRAFAAFVSLFSASALTYALAEHPVPWAALRFIDGLCMAGVFVCLESWLNERADPAVRGTVLAAYMVALYCGQAIGQLFLNLGALNPLLPFVAASMLLSLAVIPVVLTRIAQPVMGNAAPLSIGELYRISPLGIVGAGATGMMLGAFYGLGAVFARQLGLSLADTALFMSIVIFGGVILQWPLGLLSDRFDRRRVIVLVFLGTFTVGPLIPLATGHWLAFAGLGAAFGGLAFALYPLCVAHTNDHLRPSQRVGATRGLVLVYSAGAAIGPLAAALAVALLGPSGLFVFIALCAGAAAGFGLWRQLVAQPVPEARQQPYQTLPRTTPMAAALDPRASPEPPQGDDRHGIGSR